MEYIKLFETHSSYETFINGGGVAKPNVSHCIEENEVHYMPIPYDYSKDYLTIESLTDDNTISWVTHTNTYSFSGDPISYSVDDGNTWNTVSTEDFVTLNKGEKVLLKGTNSNYHYTGYSGSLIRCFFVSNSDYNIYGNILSMFYGDNFVENTELGGASFTVKGNVISAENLVLPSELSLEGSLGYMFSNCTSLTTAPSILPATTLSEYCYAYMFQGCTSLTTAPELPATTLADGCYNRMFQGCESLTTAPELPATTLADGCYNRMFQGCESLTTAPELQATTLESYCYDSMFYGCTNLTSAPELLATTLASYCYQFMFYGCTNLSHEAIVPSIYTPSNKMSSNYCRYMYGNTPLSYNSDTSVFEEMAYSTYSPK